MTTSQKTNTGSFIFILIGVALIAFFLGFFSRDLFPVIDRNLNNPGGTLVDEVVCDTSGLLNKVPTGIVLAGPLNLRSGPGLNFDVISKLEICSQIRLTGRSSDNAWLEVELPNKDKGWVFSPYIQANINIIDLEVSKAFSDPASEKFPGGSNNGRNISVIIEDNQAVAFVYGMPANQDIRAVLSPSNDDENSREVALGRTDAEGNVILVFSMPATWPDGSRLTSGTMTLALTAGSETKTVLLTYYAN